MNFNLVLRFAVFLLGVNGSVQVFGADCIRFPVRMTREIKRDLADRAPPDAALKFAQCYAFGFHFLFQLNSIIK